MGQPSLSSWRSALLALALGAGGGAGFAFAAGIEGLAASPLRNVFPLLDRYLRVPGEERALFRLRYCTQRADGVREIVRLRYITTLRDVTLATDEFGCFNDLPDLAELQANPTAVANVPEGALKVVLALEPASPLSRSMRMSDLRAAIDQSDKTARKAAGMLAWNQPHFDSVHFDIDPAAEPAGEAVFPDGQRIPLPIRDGRVMVAPDDPALAGAERVDFSGDPVAARIGFSRPIS